MGRIDNGEEVHRKKSGTLGIFPFYRLDVPNALSGVLSSSHESIRPLQSGLAMSTSGSEAVSLRVAVSINL